LKKKSKGLFFVLAVETYFVILLKLGFGDFGDFSFVIMVLVGSSMYQLQPADLQVIAGLEAGSAWTGNGKRRIFRCKC
jgi:hypothetical protein